MNAPQSDRQFIRKPLDVLVEGRMRSRYICVELLDVSEGGCKIKGRHGFAKEGEFVSLKVDDVRTPLGKVVWVNDMEAGIAFEGKMHEAIVDHLQRAQLERKLAAAKADSKAKAKDKRDDLPPLGGR